MIRIQRLQLQQMVLQEEAKSLKLKDNVDKIMDKD